MRAKLPKSQTGFTLLELVIGIVVFTISLTIVLSLIVPQAEQTAEPFRQVKAAKLGQSLMNDILSRSYDENSDRSPPFVTCVDKPDPSNASDNLCSDALGPDAGETSEEAYDDVDDYNGVDDSPPVSLIGSIDSSYSTYRVQVTVTCDGSTVSASGNSHVKKILVQVTPPRERPIAFAAYKGNF